MKEPLYIRSRESEEGAESSRREGVARGFWRSARTARTAMGLSRVPRFPRAMKRDLMEILCCPVCKGDLELTVKAEKDEILEGSLFCKNCNHRYEITDGIPDLLPPDFK